MTKHDIVEGIYSKYQGTLTRNLVKDIVSFVFDEIVREMTAGGEAKISCFGTFKIAERNAKKARNPRTGEEVMIEGRRVAKFKPSKYLQNKVNHLATDDEDEEQA